MSAGIDVDRSHAAAPAAAPGHRRRRTDVEEADAVAELSRLTTKQRDVLVLYGKGYGLKETARMLDMCESTVSRHRTDVVEVLGMTLMEAVVQCVQCVRARWV